MDNRLLVEALIDAAYQKTGGQLREEQEPVPRRSWTKEGDVMGVITEAGDRVEAEKCYYCCGGMVPPARAGYRKRQFFPQCGL